VAEPTEAPSPGSPSGARHDANEASGDEKVKVPWHFWLLVGAVALYLGWRLIQGVAWLAG
jgi:hypothetical protein